jgi:thiamine transport system ATP-binding protein
MTNTPAVQLDTVSLRLGARDFHFDCALAPGKVTAITGPSGSGKSTLLNLVAGFETPDRGRIWLEGRDMTGVHPGERPLSLVFQDNNMFSHLDLFTNIGLGLHPGLKLTAAQRQEVSDALSRVGLAGYETRKPGTLSGGERQRAAFARALVRKRPLLALDEPFAALDPALRLSMADLLTALHRETQNTILLVTHDVEEVRRLADEVIFIEAGQILFHGEKRMFLTHSDDEAISKFVLSS